MQKNMNSSALSVFILPLLAAWLILLLASTICRAQPTRTAVDDKKESLPAAGKILDEWFAVAGGEQNVRKVKDATYEWSVRSNGRDLGRGRTVRKFPDMTREEFAAGVNVTNPREVWRLRPPDKYTIIGDVKAADQLRLQSTLEASYLIDLSQLGISARTVGREKVGDEDAYAVEFSRADGSRIVWLFGMKSKLMLKVKISPQFSALYRDYKKVGELLEPHTVELIAAGQSSGLVFTLVDVKLNTNVSDEDFAVPAGAKIISPAPGAVIQ